MVKKFTFVVVCCLFGGKGMLAQQPVNSYKERIDTLAKNIYQYFYDSSKDLFYETNNIAPNEKPHSYLWPLCALIQAANETEKLSAGKDYMTPVMKAIDQYYTTISPAPAYQAYVVKEEKDDRFYDDNQWIAIACLDAYNRTKKQAYLDIAKGIYHFMMTGFDSAAGGGLYWKEGDKKTKNTCSNGPGILVALQLYKITNDKRYLDTALVLYTWVNAHLLAPQGVYYDNIRIPSLKIDSAFYTYNTGTMLQSAVLLYTITKDKKYLQQSRDIADAAQKIFYKNNRLPGNYWFNAVLIRGFIELYQVEKNKQRLQFLFDDAERVWLNEKNEKGLVGTNANKKSLIDQAAMMEIYARLAELDK